MTQAHGENQTAGDGGISAAVEPVLTEISPGPVEAVHGARAVGAAQEPGAAAKAQGEGQSQERAGVTPSQSAVPLVEKRGVPRIIALMNQKGGVGKTTTCVNLGAALARQGARVLLVDIDPQAHLSLHLGIEPERIEKSLYDLLTDPQTTAMQIVQQAEHEENLAILPAEVNLAGVEGELADKVVTGAAQGVLRRKCQDLVTQFDYVLIDCPPSLGLLTINALTMANEVIVPMQAHFLALQGLSKLLETVNMVREGINPKLKVSGVVICMHESQTILAGEVMADLERFMEGARGTDLPWCDAVVYQPPVRRNIKLAESPSFGQSIFGYAGDCHGAKDYAKLAESVAAHRVSM